MPCASLTQSEARSRSKSLDSLETRTLARCKKKKKVARGPSRAPRLARSRVLASRATVCDDRSGKKAQKRKETGLCIHSAKQSALTASQLPSSAALASVAPPKGTFPKRLGRSRDRTTRARHVAFENTFKHVQSLETRLRHILKTQRRFAPTLRAVARKGGGGRSFSLSLTHTHTHTRSDASSRSKGERGGSAAVRRERLARAAPREARERERLALASQPHGPNRRREERDA